MFHFSWAPPVMAVMMDYQKLVLNCWIFWRQAWALSSTTSTLSLLLLYDDSSELALWISCLLCSILPPGSVLFLSLAPFFLFLLVDDAVQITKYIYMTDTRTCVNAYNYLFITSSHVPSTTTSSAMQVTTTQRAMVEVKSDFRNVTPNWLLFTIF